MVPQAISTLFILLMTSRRFSKSMRLLRSRDFERVFAGRVTAGNDSILVFGAANVLGHPRLGLTVSRKFGKAARRNRWKRVVREAFRLTQHELPSLDLVCLPRGPAEADLRRLLTDLPALAARIDRRLQSASDRATRKAP